MKIAKSTEARSKIRQVVQKRAPGGKIYANRGGVEHSHFHLGEQRHQEQLALEAAAETREEPAGGSPKQPKAVKSEQGIIVEGLDNCLVKFSKCCSPVPGDDIVGFITRGYGVSVHRADCPNAAPEKRKEQPGRWIKVSWGSDTNDSYPTSIEVVCKDRLNLLLDISSALSSTKTFVLGLNTRSTEDGFAIIRIEVRIQDSTPAGQPDEQAPSDLRRAEGQPTSGLIPIPETASGLTAVPETDGRQALPPFRCGAFQIRNKESSPCVQLLPA